MVAEAAAAKAAAQLLAEEDQAASKAAAKKAKKLRQKLSKKQQAQSDTAELTSAETLNSKDTVEAEAPTSQPPGQLEALRLPTAPASADDSWNQSEAATQPHPVADSQPPPLHPHVPSCSQDTTSKLHVAPQQSTVCAQPAPSVPMLDQSGGLAVHGFEQASIVIQSSSSKTSKKEGLLKQFTTNVS